MSFVFIFREFAVSVSVFAEEVAVFGRVVAVVSGAVVRRFVRLVYVDLSFVYGLEIGERSG